MRLLGRLLMLRTASRRFSVRPLSIAPWLFVGVAIDQRGAEELVRAGFRSILNLTHEKEPGQVASPDIEGSWGPISVFERARLSVGSSPRRDDFERLCHLLDELPGPIYLHSTDGELALAMGVACVARRQGWGGRQALREAESRALALQSEPLKRFLLETLGEPGSSR